jgi:hypothetical protein
MNDGGPAFPIQQQSWNNMGGSGFVNYRPGMSLRDYLAAHAMVALMTSPHLELKQEMGTHENIALGAYEFADAMLAARSSGDLQK